MSIRSSEIVSAFQPSTRIFLLVVGAYYLVVSMNHLVTETGISLASMVALSITSSVAAFCASAASKQSAKIADLERYTFIGHIILLLNLNLFYFFAYDPNRLVYFIISIIVFCLTSPTLRLAVLSCALVLGSLFLIVYRNDPSLLQTYMFIGIAASFAAGGWVAMLWKIILSAIESKLAANAAEHKADQAATFATELAVTDALTELPNRRGFFNHLDNVSSSIAEYGLRYAVFVIDLDGFKPINDTYGHGIGDKLLMKAAERLADVLPDSALVARTGGDEFAVLAPTETEDEATRLGDTVCLKMRAPFDLGGVIVHVGASVGLAISTNETRSLHDVLEQADFALFSAKRSCKGQCAVFSQEHAEKMRLNFRIEQALRRAELESELSVVYQPQVDVMTGEIIGFEALARWDSPVLGKVPPSDFIPVAETSGLIKAITQMLLKKALVDQETWNTQAALSFNLSVHDILNDQSVEEIVQIVGNSGIDPGRICFEITETVMVCDGEKAEKALQRFRDAGFSTALDDFGTGYSNFSALHELPIDRIKIDKSFIRSVSRSEIPAKVMSTLLQLTRSLQKECVIEGVENDTEAALVRGLGARFLQGYHYGRPTSSDKVSELLDGIASRAAAKTRTG